MPRLQRTMAIFLAAVVVTGTHYGVYRVLGNGVASTCTGWLLGTASVLYHLTTKYQPTHYRQSVYVCCGFYLTLTSLFCSYIVMHNAAAVRLPLVQKLSVVSPASPEAAAMTHNLYQVDALVELIKNTFLLVSAALGANFIFAGLTSRPQE